MKAKFFCTASGIIIIVDNNFIFPNRDSIPLNSQTFFSLSSCGCVVQKGNKVLNIWKFKIIKKMNLHGMRSHSSLSSVLLYPLMPQITIIQQREKKNSLWIKWHAIITARFSQRITRVIYFHHHGVLITATDGDILR